MIRLLALSLGTFAFIYGSLVCAAALLVAGVENVLFLPGAFIVVLGSTSFAIGIITVDD